MKRTVLLLFLCAASLQGVNFHYLDEQKGPRSFNFEHKGDFFAEMVYAPLKTPGAHLIGAFGSGKEKFELFHRQKELQIFCNGKKRSSYPFYHAGHLGAVPRCDRYRILLQQRKNELIAAVEGEIIARIPSSLPHGKKQFKTAGQLSSLRISSGSIAPEGLRRRHLDFWRNITPAVPVPAAAAAPPELDALPAVDGKAEEKILSQCTRLALRSMNPRSLHAGGKSSNCLYLGRKGEKLYLFWQLERKNPAPPFRCGKRDQGLWNVESAEFFLLPPGMKKPFQFILSSGGDLYDGMGSDRSWNGEVRFAARTEKERWNGEMIITAGTRSLPSFREEGWKMDFFASLNWEAWSPAGRYHDTDSYGFLLLPQAPPRITANSLRAAAAGTYTFTEAFYAPCEVDPETRQVKKFLKSGEVMDLPYSFSGKKGMIVRTVQKGNQVLFRHIEKTGENKK